MGRKNKESIILNGVRIESVAAEGKAIAHVHIGDDDREGGSCGRVIFVEYAVPGDVVDILVTKKKKNYAEGRVIRIVEPSPDRQEAFCSHFGLCGGCKWQLLPYHLQLEAKRQQVYDQLVRIGHLDVSEVKPVIGSEQIRYYRNKLEFAASNRRWILPDEDEADIPAENRQGLGFHVGRFFDKVLDISHCYLQKEPSNAIRLFIKNYALEHGIGFYDMRENRGLLRTVFVRTSEGGDVMVIVCFGDESDKIFPMLDALAEQFPQISSLYYIVNRKCNDSISDQTPLLYRGNDAIYETMEDLRFRIGPKSFYQTNASQALELYRVARNFAGLSGTETVYDLYTGTGTIAQFVARQAAKVIGIEYVPEAIEDAVLNASANGITNCSFFAGDMKDILTSDFIAEHGRPDVMIVDPPRAGMHPDVVKTILEAAPDRIVYVSCNPASQARDLQTLCTKYKITDVQPVDMFPHTIHVENVCRLVKIEE